MDFFADEADFSCFAFPDFELLLAAEELELPDEPEFEVELVPEGELGFPEEPDCGVRAFPAELYEPLT